MNFEPVFRKISNRFFKEDLLKEVYSNKEVCICNAANSGYVIFYYDLLKNGIKDFCGILFPGKLLEEAVKNPNYILECFKITPDNEKSKNLFMLNDIYFNATKKVKAYTDINGPYPAIRLDIEEKIQSKGSSK